MSTVIAPDPPIPTFVGLPSSLLTALADGCVAAGEPGIRALREAGRSLGEALYETLGHEPEHLAPQAFWNRVNRRLRELRLGSLRFEALGEDLASVAWYALPEAGTPDGPLRRTRGCHLATGALAGLLARVAGGTVAVLEAACGANSPHACRFLIGSGDRLREVHRRIATGEPLARALRES